MVTRICVCWRVLRFKGGHDTATSAVFTQGSLAAEYMRMKYARHNFARHHGVLSLALRTYSLFFPGNVGSRQHQKKL